ncbi:hypothetical protein [Leptolinea tardivitalis]|uniref:Glycosyltransferase RgtA/B/C/D-like domain-containing protein n=1 Tax=Leptolinea tardivitalis TaxID=229920 RepID=A0A0N8GKN8_9CHLR|nr:hypothetical protein [Leptolinea tardivitalis]KPL70218.1 hypothetical protein ADM99_13610 [Leptolinea tardivitalis]GAP21757.1 4-amino-4-deoxy-L-arabinose transferase [Leptolinea tardivitalis]
MRKTIWIISLLAILIFCAYIPLNNKGAATAHELSRNSVDESFQYPFLIHMITPGKTAAETHWRLISYGHYIYGYPFYVASALAAAPVQIMYGEETENQVQLIVLLERQLVSVLPMLLAIGIFTYLATRFKSTLISIFVFLFLCTIPGIVRQNIWWWHPDALTILCVALTFFFLDRDSLRFSRNFYIAALFCGLATGLKTIGGFFAPVIAYLLIRALIEKKLTLKKAIISGLGFIMVMVASIFISNPLLFIPSARDRIIQVHVDHNYFFTHGWADDDPYGVGWAAWQPVLNGWYGSYVLLAFALCTHFYNSIYGKIKEISRMYVAWIIPFSLYIIYIIAVKPDHYWMPIMLPLFSGIFPMLQNLWDRFIEARKVDTDRAFMYCSFATITVIFLIVQIIFNLQTGWAVFSNAL